ncbi:uncharacterized protein LOC120263170 [Dioscorea cayenensis subsp. rotundata]|uniref:Uncharacterized protein LOC120263170 n=1 Tax=Dioscorea cayennensis subsp. rotundata TaxID=55577 RepID=A0AB40BKU8_DIOCR|nr:uncharacterized protein LOC120263170 [Dioscorea cayenensis subsp. rotundata]
MIRNTNAIVWNLEHHMAQMSKLIEEKLSGSLPNTTKINPKESLKGVSLNSRKQLRNYVNKEAEKDVEQSNIVDLEAPLDEKEKTIDQGKEKSAPLVYQPKLTYPTKMPRYAKFLKELLTNKRKLEDMSSVTLSEECSALITNSLPKKEKDPGGLIIPCTISGLIDEKLLDNLGASINLMPYKIFQKLALGESKPTPMTLQLADRSIRQPRRIMEYVLVNVEVPLILGRPFLATSKALIDVKDGRMDMFMKDELAELLEDNPL